MDYIAKLCREIEDSYAMGLQTCIDRLLDANIRWRGDDRFRDDISILTLEIRS